jgi:general secretion pathway protein F
MELSADVVSSALRPALDAATLRVREGRRLSDALDAEGLCTAVSARMLRVGEGSGTLGGMLERAAGFYDEELARFSEWATKVVGPVLMLAIGAVVGGIVLLMYMPIFEIAERIQ